MAEETMRWVPRWVPRDFAEHGNMVSRDRYAVVDDSLSATSPPGDAMETLSRQAACARQQSGRAAAGKTSLRRRLHVLLDDLHCLRQFLCRTELDDFRTGIDVGRVAGRHVVGVAGLERLLLSIRGCELDPALDDVAPVRGLALVVGQPREERRQVGVGGVPLEGDGVAALQGLQVALVALDTDALGRRCL